MNRGALQAVVHGVARVGHVGLSKGPRTTEYEKPIAPKTHLSLVGKGGREKSNQKQLSVAGWRSSGDVLFSLFLMEK